MERRQHETPGQRGLNGRVERLAVANLTDHDDIRILPENRAQPFGEGKARLVVRLSLIGTRDRVLDRVLDGDDVSSSLYQCGQRRIERRTLSAARWTGDENHP